jgi:predicted AAA+ superfamily ATPase
VEVHRPSTSVLGIVVRRTEGESQPDEEMLGQLVNAGNTTTLSRYLDLLAGAGMLVGLEKYSGSAIRRRGSRPKLQVLNNALATAPLGMTIAEARADRVLWGRLVESAVGAYLANAAAAGFCQLFYWCDRDREVDFVLQKGKQLVAIEVESGGRAGRSLPA